MCISAASAAPHFAIHFAYFANANTILGYLDDEDMHRIANLKLKSMKELMNIDEVMREQIAREEAEQAAGTGSSSSLSNATMVRPKKVVL